VAKPAARKGSTRNKQPEAKATSVRTSSEPKYPYCTTPKSLRRFLEMAPEKPKPPKVVGSTLKVWGLKNSNDQTILRVLKALGLLTSNGETTPIYADFMKRETGAATLGRQIRTVYPELFQNVAKPETASNDDLKNFFNIHSGGSENTVRLQIDTFKALAEYATFGQSDPLDASAEESRTSDTGTTNASVGGEPTIRIDLHIHLPENKTKSDYDAILESIATHLYKRTP
jgi:hypothetical protein